MDARGDAHQHAFFALLDGTDRTHLVASALLASAGARAVYPWWTAGPNVHVIGTQNELDFALPALSFAGCDGCDCCQAGRRCGFDISESKGLKE